MSGYEPGDRPTILNRTFQITFAIGLVVIAAAVAAVFFMQRTSHIELKGSILKIRTMEIDQDSSLAVVDFRFANPADFPFVVRTVDVSIVGVDGQTYPGTTVSEMDAKRLFAGYPVLGQKFNDSLITRDRIPPQHTEDRMIAARFEIPLAKLDARTSLKIRIEDVDGPVSELVQK